MTWHSASSKEPDHPIQEVFPTTAFVAVESYAGGPCKDYSLEHSSYLKAISVLIQEKLQHEGQSAEGNFEAENDRLH